jgi:drug/metabolite transporter (DMT)-like permease
MSKPPPNTNSASLAGILLVNLATFTWATNIVLGRWLRNDIGPLTLAAARFVVASAVFTILLRRQPAEERQVRDDRWLLLAMALSGVVLFAPTLYLGLRFTTATNATLINSFGPLITGVLATVMIREPMSQRQVVGALLGLGGIVILVSGGSLAVWSSLRVNVGDLIALCAATLWSLYSVLGRRAMASRSALSVTAFSAFLGLPFLLAASALELRTGPVDLNLRLLVAILYIGLAPTVGGFLAWNAGVHRLGASGAMVFCPTLPLYGVLLGTVFLDESPGVPHLVGGALFIGGALWAARR